MIDRHDEVLAAVGRGRLARREATPPAEAGPGTVAVYSLDAEGRVASWNPDAQRLKGYRGEEILGQHFSVFYPPELAAVGYPQEELERAAEVGVHIDEGWRIRKDGTRFWAYIIIAARRSEQGVLQGFVKVVRDDSEAHARQQRSYRRFSDLLTLAPVGVCFVDDNDRVREVNNALCRLVRHPRAELLEMTGADLLHPLDGGGGLTSENALSEEDPETPVSRSRVLRRSDGEPIHCDVYCTLSVQDDGSHFWLVVFQDVTERIHQAEVLQHQLNHDALTGLPNRRGVDELLDNAGRLAVLFCDIDNFKRINDSLGHAAGDELIVTVAQRLHGELGEECTVARLSGDEFLIACTDVDAVGGLRVLAERVAGMLRMVVPVRGHLVRVSASVGAAMFPESGTSGEDLLRFADAAMFRAKRHGPGRVVLADPALTASLAEQMGLEEQLGEALRTDGLRLHYQPIVDRDRTVVSAEALVRWPHPRMGLLSPDVILPIAEQGNLLHELDLWVLRAALRDAVGWPQPVRGRQVRVSANLSGRFSAEVEFLDAVGAILADSGIDLHRVVLEVTETSLVELSAAARDAMHSLIRLGVSFAVDDFGTGYSSLARLKDLPAQVIKLDRQFISGLETQEADRAIVRSAIDMAHATDRRCVAEGVETAAQFHLLNELGVDAHQGWLFSRPLPLADFRAMVRGGPLPVPDHQP
ncbi:EAL domain-containing protein [Saccharopolyspora erythraea]|uniref:sensor domain-containing protein n=1 Tax=Saccharopolyspora erythraea TaxID=1836 RepID=UPI001BA8AA3C|nr:EAL domain-containing protein [Saccharopolyspora erythraea]QUH03332.1 EAL domain-containing protein [Saccharopolyspora erythraea]